MSDDADKWAGLFGDESEDEGGGESDAERSAEEGRFVDPGPPETAVPRDDEHHDSELPPAEELGELTDEFTAIENQFLGELESVGEEPADDEPIEQPRPDREPGAVEPPPEELSAEVPPGDEPPAEEAPAAKAPRMVDPQPTEESEAVVPVVPAPPPPPAVSQPTAAQRSLAATVEQLSKEQIDERRPSPMWMRFLAGSLVIVIAMATATAVSLIVYLSDIAKGLADNSGELKGVKERLAAVDGGEPQTILILGSDIRPEIEERGRSDTTMLLRLDGDRNVISLFSLPRDLRVNIPGVGIDKLNAAYTYGGPKKTLETVQAVTGLEINHVVNVDFRGFGKAVDAIDCVYVDVDREYYHSNVGLAASEHYAEIDIGAGYQRLCGERALQYVRYRHTDNDIVRAARQQDFLREARQKVSPARLWNERDEMIDIFTKYTSSDIDDLPTMIEVLKLFIDAREAPVNQVHFEGGFEETYVTASNSQMKQAVAQFLGETPTGASRPSAGEKRPPEPNSDDKPQGPDKQKKEKPKPTPVAATPMIDSGAETLAFVELMARRKRMPAYLPTRITPNSFFDDETRGYQVRLPNDKFDDAYKIVFQKSGVFGVPEYYGVMATEWTDPPILENPSEVREIDGRDYMLFYDAGRLRLVGFKTNQGSYWVSNTLLQTLSEQEMLAVATGMREVRG